MGTENLVAFLAFWYPNGVAPLPLPFPFCSGATEFTLPTSPTLAGGAAVAATAAFGSGAAKDTPELNWAWLKKCCAPCRQASDNPLESYDFTKPLHGWMILKIRAHISKNCWHTMTPCDKATVTGLTASIHPSSNREGTSLCMFLLF